MNLDKLLQTATFAGRILLENGAEIYRVEETINKICHSYNIYNCDSFVTLTGIVVSIYDNDNTVTAVKRITDRKVDLNKIDKVNDLSRRIVKDNISLDNLYYELSNINKEKPYSNKIFIIFSALCAASFTYILGGNSYDFFISLIMGFFVSISQLKFNRYNINAFFSHFFCSALASLIAVIFHLLINDVSIDKTIIGTIMLLVPGLAITNAVRDIINGDFLAGIAKAAEALMVAISLAAGSGTVLSIYYSALGGAL